MTAAWLSIGMGFVAPSASPAATPDDQPPFEAWLRPLLPSVWLFVCRFAQTQDREDVYQSTLLAAWRKRHLYRPESIKSTNLAAGACRRPVPESPPNRCGAPSPSFTGRSPKTIDVEAAIDMRRAIMTLTKRQRVAVELFYVMDLTVTDCSRVMGCSVGTVKSTLSTRATALRRQLGASQ